ncbi:MAG: peptidoglycan DD-metalloendopeptidase family protein [Pseudomonadales bacterium]
MNLIFVSHRHGKAKSLALSHRKVLLSLLALLMIITAAFVVGYQVAGRSDTAEQQRAFVQAWQKELDQKRQEIERIKEDSQEQVKALTIRMAELHAKLIRLDALGEHLITTANIDADEFDFSNPPPVGGIADTADEEAYQPPGFLRAVEALAFGIEQREQKLEMLNQVLGNQEYESDRYLSGRPIRKGWLSSYFGRRNDPFTGKLAWHEGIDFAGREGSDIIAVAAGVVTWSGERYGYGNLVEVNHGGGYVTRYAHARDILVKVGDVVEKGQTVALMGSSGRSTGPHVHFEVLRGGKSVDPLRYVNRKAK